MAFSRNSIQELMNSAVVDGECNCYQCRTTRLNVIMGKFVEEYRQHHKHNLPLMCTIEYRSFQQIFPTFSDNTLDRYVNIYGWLTRIDAENEKTLSSHKKDKLTWCDCCGRYHSTKSTKRFHFREIGTDITICPQCMTYFRICGCCNVGTVSGLPLSRMINTKKGTICLDCYKKYYYHCIRCDSTFERDGTEIDWRRMQGIADPAGRQELLCPRCFKEHALKCSTCSGWMLDTSAHRLRNSTKPICYDCYALQVQDIQSFNFKPRRFNKLVGKHETSPPREDALLFGVELEMEPLSSSMYDRDEMAAIMLKLCGRDKFFVKHDGTVRSGIELVSNPFSWQWLKENKEYMQSVFKEIAKRKYSARHTGNAGFHVHLTKKAFGTFHLYKFLQFYYKASVQAFIKLVSERRTGWQYASFRVEDSGVHTKRVAKEKINMIPASRSSRDSTTQVMRHSAISLMFEPTVEVRIFAGVDTMSIFMKNMEFIRSTYDFTRDCTLNDLVITRYIHYIMDRKNRNKYQTLIKFLANSPNMKEQYIQSYNYINRNL